MREFIEITGFLSVFGLVLCIVMVGCCSIIGSYHKQIKSKHWEEEMQAQYHARKMFGGIGVFLLLYALTCFAIYSLHYK